MFSYDRTFSLRTYEHELSHGVLRIFSSYLIACDTPVHLFHYEITHIFSLFGDDIELDKLAGEPVDILVNHKPIAKGEVVVIDENFGVRVTSVFV